MVTQKTARKPRHEQKPVEKPVPAEANAKEELES